MNDHDNTERILRTTAAADTAAHRLSVSPTDTNAALAAVRARAAAGDTGTITTTETLRRPARNWRPFAAAAAVVALIGGGALALTLRSDDDRTVAPATDSTDATTSTTNLTVTVPSVADDEVLIQLGEYVIGSVPDGYVIGPELVVYGDRSFFGSVDGQLQTGQLTEPQVEEIFATAATLPEPGTYGENAATDVLPTHLQLGQNSWNAIGDSDVLSPVIAQLRLDVQQSAERQWDPERWIVWPFDEACEVVAAVPIQGPYVAPVFPHVLAQYLLGPCADSSGIVQPTIPYACVGENTCTQLIGTADGRIVAYSPAEETLTVYDSTGTQELLRVVLAEPLADAYPWLVTVGPADVVYINMSTPGASDPIADLIAIPLTGPGAGKVVQRWTGLDGSGDSTLVPQVDGIVSVGCCGFLETRPSAEAERYPYVDENGAAIASTATTFRLDLTPDGGTLVRIDNGVETVFALPATFQAPRDFPRVVATTDGGAMALDWIDMLDSGGMYIARFLPATDISPQQVEVYRLDTTQLALMEPSGTVLLATGDHFTRASIEDIGLLQHGDESG